MLELFAIYSVSCYHTILRMISNYLDIIVIKIKKKRESIRPINKFISKKASVYLWANSFINVLGRINNKGF